MEEVVIYLGSDFECRGPRTYSSKPTRTVLSREKLVEHPARLRPGPYAWERYGVWEQYGVWEPYGDVTSPAWFLSSCLTKRNI